MVHCYYDNWISFYWLISYFILKIGFKKHVSVFGLEFFRLWLKPLFILNFTWFILIEIVFSLVYWTKFLLLNIISFFKPVFLLINRFHPPKPNIWLWLFISLIIFIVVMIPYFILQYKLSFYFKRTVFTKLASSINAKNINFHGQSANFNLDQNLYTQLAARDEKTKIWIEESLREYKLKPGKENKRFYINNSSTDHMSWEIDNFKADFFESVIEFNGEIKQEDDKGKISYKIDYVNELFDGIVIVIENVFTESWKPTVFETERVFIGKEKKNREIHKQKFLIRLYNNIVFKSISSKSVVTHKNSSIGQYVDPDKIKITTDSLFQYILCNQNNLYLLLKTELEGTAFDLNMNVPVKNSMELFKQDLSLVETAMSEVSTILKYINDNNIKNSIEVA